MKKMRCFFCKVFFLSFFIPRIHALSSATADLESALIRFNRAIDLAIGEKTKKDPDQCGDC